MHLAHIEQYYSNAMRQQWITCKPPQNKIRNGIWMAAHNTNKITIIILSILSLFSLDVLIPWREWRMKRARAKWCIYISCVYNVHKAKAKIATVIVDINVSGEWWAKATTEEAKLRARRKYTFNGFSNPKTFRNDGENEICIKLSQMNENANSNLFFSSCRSAIVVFSDHCRYFSIPTIPMYSRYSFHSNYCNDENLWTGSLVANPE